MELKTKIKLGFLTLGAASLVVVNLGAMSGCGGASTDGGVTPPVGSVSSLTTSQQQALLDYAQGSFGANNSASSSSSSGLTLENKDIVLTLPCSGGGHVTANVEGSVSSLDYNACGLHGLVFDGLGVVHHTSSTRLDIDYTDFSMTRNTPGVTRSCIINDGNAIVTYSGSTLPYTGTITIDYNGSCEKTTTSGTEHHTTAVAGTLNTSTSGASAATAITSIDGNLTFTVDGSTAACHFDFPNAATVTCADVATACSISSTLCLGD